MFNTMLQIDMLLVVIKLAKEEGLVAEKGESSTENRSNGRGSNNQTCMHISLNDPYNVGRYIVYGAPIHQ